MFNKCWASFFVTNKKLAVKSDVRLGIFIRILGLSFIFIAILDKSASRKGAKGESRYVRVSYVKVGNDSL